jgi:aldose 1-epimerase
VGLFYESRERRLFLQSFFFSFVKPGCPIERLLFLSMRSYKLSNPNGVEMQVSDFGAIIQNLKVPDRDGVISDITLGFDTLDAYRENEPYFGAVIGRFGNRIADGRFSLDGTLYSLAVNNGKNHLHGGIIGFNKVLWEVVEIRDETELKLCYTSADGEEGYPGELSVEVTYGLNDRNELSIRYHATTTKPTHINLTHHAYFNLAGHDKGSVLDQEILINADSITPTDATSIPTGDLRAVEGTVFDFRQQKRIGKSIDSEQIHFAGGYDHNFVLNKQVGELSHAATVVDPCSGRMMEVFTTEPGLQFYTGNYLDGVNGKEGACYRRRDGFCLETQHFPDTPNQPTFPSTRIDPGQDFHSETIYRFGVVS